MQSYLNALTMMNMMMMRSIKVKVNVNSHPSSQPSIHPSSQPPQPPRQYTPTSTSGTSTSNRKKKTTQATAAADEGIVVISDKIQGMERVEKHVEPILTWEKSPIAAWATWIGAELEQMHPHVWDECRDQTYEVIWSMKARSNKICQREHHQQQQQPSQPAEPELQWMQQQQQQQKQQQQSYINPNIPTSQTLSSTFNTYLSNSVESLLLQPG